jgi:hypothetical protein
LRSRIRTFTDVAEALAEDAAAYGSWAAWDAAVALDLAGEVERAAAMFGRVVATDDNPDWWLPVQEDATRLTDLVINDRDAFRAQVGDWIARYREALRLPPSSGPP